MQKGRKMSEQGRRNIAEGLRRAKAERERGGGLPLRRKKRKGRRRGRPRLDLASVNQALAASEAWRPRVLTILSSRAGRLLVEENDCILLVARSGKQLIFVYGFTLVNEGPRTRSVLRSERLRITNGRPWNPLALQEYAAEVGLGFEGIRRFEEYYKARGGK